MRRAIERLFEARRAPLIFLIGVYLVGITTGNLADALGRLISPWLIFLFGTMVLLILIVILDPERSLLRWLRWNYTATPESEPDQSPPRYPGLIVCASLGGGITSAETAIQYHWKGIESEHKDAILNHCWIITGGEASKKQANDMIVKLIGEGFPYTIFRPIVELTAQDADNPESVYNAINKIYEEISDLDLPESQVIADYTGGTKSMTSGMILACALPGRKLQFMKPRAYDSDGRADLNAGSDPIVVDINFKLKPIKK